MGWGDMNRSTLLLLGVVALGPFAARVRAEEKVIILTNGRKLRGEIAQQDSNVVVIKTAGGTTTLPSALVARVEDPLKPDGILVKPSPPPPEVDDPLPGMAPPSAPAAPTPNSAVVPRAAPTTDLAPGTYTGATAAVMSDCATALLAAGTLPDDVRPARLQETVTTFGPGALVGILNAPIPRNDPRFDSIRQLAKAALATDTEKSRPEVVRAVVALRGDVAFDFLPILESVYDKSVEDAIAGMLPTAVPSSLRELVEMLGRHGTPRSAQALGGLLLASLTGFQGMDPNLPAMCAQALVAIALRSDPPGAAIAPLAREVVLDKLPSGDRLEHLLTVLAVDPRSDNLIERISRVVDAELRALPQDAPLDVREQAVRRREFTFRALARLSTEEPLDIVRTAVEQENDDALRLRWLKTLRFATDASTDAKLVGWLLERWTKNPAEGATVIEVLTAVTGKTWGNNQAAWREYLGTIEPQKR